ncbi:MAG: hypothetical protein A2V90_03895 [Gammaproteobacteria bacterium RBG_16_57_12]|nr:MAG: hypothetical protein A2V90_03895 [Gammaproteobacteria bacterium RBG_16_57_12]
MDTQQITEKLAALKKKQGQILEAWQKTGNKSLIQFIIEIMPKAMKAERCSIYIVDPTRSDAWIQSGTGLTEKQVTIPLETSSIVGQVIKTGTYKVEEDLEDKVGAHVAAAAKTGFVVRNVLCVPVHSTKEAKVIGAIQMLNKFGGGYTEDDRKMLERLAGVLQTSIEQMYQRQELLNISNEMELMILNLERQLIKANLQKS